MADSIENKLLDKRVAHRYLRKGKLDEKDYDKHVKALPDLADQAIPVQASMDDDFDDLDDVDDDLDDETDEVAEVQAQGGAEDASRGAGEPEGGAGGGTAQP